MNSHLSVRIAGRFLALPDDASIDIEDSNPFFNDTQETWSLPFEVPINGNREILGNIDDIASDLRLVAHENKLMDVFIDGIEFRNGKVATTEDQEINGKITLSLTSVNKQLSELFGDLSLRDIVFPDEDMDSLQIGEMIGEVSVKGYSKYSIEVESTVRKVKLDAEITRHADSPHMVPNIVINKTDEIWMGIHDYYDQHIMGERVVYPQALGFSTPREYAVEYGPVSKQYLWQVRRDANGDPVVNKSFINVDAPYGTSIVQPDGTIRKALYFNARVCYIHHSLDAEGESSDAVEYDKGGYGPYFVLDADRPQSGICFYMLYVLRSMFHTLGVTYGNEQEAVLMAVPDMCRLGFFTTLCKFDQVTNPTSSIDGLDVDFPYDDNFDKNFVNLWLSERNTDGQLKTSSNKNDEVKDSPVTIEYYSRFQGRTKGIYEVVKEEKYIRSVTAVKNAILPVEFYNVDTNETTTLNFSITKVKRVDKGSEYKYSARISRMYANADNLPDMQMSSFVDSLWTAFGIKFNYDAKNNVVTPRFIRDILRDKHDPIVMPGAAWTIYRNSEKFTGFRMHYGSESDPKEQSNFIRKRVTDYDTSYDYRVEESRYLTPMTQSYFDFVNSIFSVSDETCYVDIKTGNAYRIKISKEALNNGDVNKLQPSVFQVGQWHGVEIGDCSEENEDFVIDISIEFEPLDQNDVNWGRGRSAAKLCPFVDDEMWSEKVKKLVIASVVESNITTVYTINEEVMTDEKYDPQSSDDGNSPLQSHDWGNAICMMRGGGADARIDYYDFDYDGFGSYKIRTVAGDYAMDSDSISLYGDEYDYNGTGGGIGEGERFSLKIRAFHTDANGNRLCSDDRIARRGLFDRFMSDYAHFVLNRKKVTVTGRVNAIDIKNIQWDRRYNIGGVIGWINKISTHISAEKGIETCTFEMYIL